MSATSSKNGRASTHTTSPRLPASATALPKSLRCDVMLSMDSANMHLASLVELPVVSVWGATHPYCGFTGWHQNPANEVQTDLPCRPCSVFGNKPCQRGDYACLRGIDYHAIVQRLDNVINQR